MKRPLCLDLFSGAGGTAIGLHRAGFDVTHFEWDADACATLRAAFPGDEVHEGDLRQSPWESWAGGGPPPVVIIPVPGLVDRRQAGGNTRRAQRVALDGRGHRPIPTDVGPV